MDTIFNSFRQSMYARGLLRILISFNNHRAYNKILQTIFDDCLLKIKFNINLI